MWNANKSPNALTSSNVVFNTLSIKPLAFQHLTVWSFVPHSDKTHRHSAFKSI